MPKQISDIVKITNLQFLSNLDTRLNEHIVPYHILKKDKQFYGQIHRPNYEYATIGYCNPEKNIYSSEIKDLLNIIDGKKYILSPVNTGLSRPGFVVLNTKGNSLLYFSERQTPGRYGFYTLSKVFMQEQNIKSAEKLDILILNSLRRYTSRLKG